MISQGVTVKRKKKNNIIKIKLCEPLTNTDHGHTIKSINFY